MAELIDSRLFELPTLYCVGVELTVDNNGENPLPAEWQRMMQSGLFERLGRIPDAYSDDYVGLIHSWPGDMSSFKYIIGMLYKTRPESVDPDITVLEMPAGKAMCGYVRGVDESYVIMQAHDLTMARLQKQGYQFDMDRLWLMEGYNNPRWTKPDAQGRVIFDYYVPVLSE